MVYTQLMTILGLALSMTVRGLPTPQFGLTGMQVNGGQFGNSQYGTNGYDRNGFNTGYQGGREQSVGQSSSTSFQQSSGTSTQSSGGASREYGSGGASGFGANGFESNGANNFGSNYVGSSTALGGSLGLAGLGGGPSLTDSSSHFPLPARQQCRPRCRPWCRPGWWLWWPWWTLLISAPT
ncbi:hypothetical protein VP01_331g5 [Puccinia sorghi]|uniref:Uncharacterized protein n=1 Tax=Puccinia sorghi TaxID=27349 RepID=A0A0L6UZ61_9BASI|nr:hypothetical protein VP01_331g5 [Puccinia sorghi]